MKNLHWEELDLHLRNISGPWLAAAQGTASWIPLWNEVCLHLQGKFPGKTPQGGAEGRILALGLWILTHRIFQGPVPLEEGFATFRKWAAEVSAQVNPGLFLSDGERREELIRRILATYGFGVEGEEVARSAERLEVLDSLARARILRDAQAAQKRAQEIREALARQEAEEAASKYTRE